MSNTSKPSPWEKPDGDDSWSLAEARLTEARLAGFVDNYVYAFRAAPYVLALVTEDTDDDEAERLHGRPL